MFLTCGKFYIAENGKFMACNSIISQASNFKLAQTIAGRWFEIIGLISFELFDMKPYYYPTPAIRCKSNTDVRKYCMVIQTVGYFV